MVAVGLSPRWTRCLLSPLTTQKQHYTSTHWACPLLGAAHSPSLLISLDVEEHCPGRRNADCRSEGMRVRMLRPPWVVFPAQLSVAQS